MKVGSKPVLPHLFDSTVSSHPDLWRSRKPVKKDEYNRQLSKSADGSGSALPGLFVRLNQVALFQGAPPLVNESILLRSSLTRCTAHANTPTIKSLNRSVRDCGASPPPSPVPSLLLCCTKHLQGLTDKYKTGRGEHSPPTRTQLFFSPASKFPGTQKQQIDSL